MYFNSPNSSYDIDDRLKLIGRVVLCVLVVLVFRLAWLQIIQGTDLRSMAENNRMRIIKTRTPRGIIYDHNGVPLATNKRVFSIFFDPVGSNEREKQNSYNKLVRILLDHNPNYAEALTKQNTLPDKFQPRKVAEDVSFDVVAAIREESVDLPGVYVKDEFIRYYPLDNGTAHLMGYLRGITVDELQKPQYQDYELSDVVGRNGIEQVYEQNLRGKAGGWVIEVDAHGRKRRDMGMQNAIPGNNLVVNIDYYLQQKAYELLKGKRGTIIALNPNNGAVLAMVSEPSYNSNILSGYITNAEWAKIANDPGHPIENRAIRGAYPPGSVFKLITATAGLEQGKIKPATSFHCTGSYQLGKWVFKCSHVHGTLDLVRAISLSCNVYFYNTARLVGIESLLDLASHFGLGKPTGIDVLNERSGFLPTKEWKKKNRKEGWYPGDTVQLGIGQGFLLVTPLQMVSVVATIANGGNVYRPRIVKQIEDGSGKIIQKMAPVVNERVEIPPDILAVVRKGMWGVVNGYGTAGLARLPDVEVAGKTGTAQSGTGGADHAWFCGYAPFKSPEIVVLAMVEGGGFGGVAAAPLSREMMRTYFDLKKGIIPRPPVSFKPAESPLTAMDTIGTVTPTMDVSTTDVKVEEEKKVDNGTPD